MISTDCQNIDIGSYARQCLIKAGFYFSVRVRWLRKICGAIDFVPSFCFFFSPLLLYVIDLTEGFAVGGTKKKKILDTH
jgi:hypothetical protein